jgi:hypothetical protein
MIFEVDFVSCHIVGYKIVAVLMVSRSFWVEVFGSLRYRIISSANKDILTVSLPICIPFIPSSA